MIEKIVVPVLGESITEATVSKWLKNEGDKVEADEPIVELETDKVNVEVPAPSNGVLESISVNEGETVNVGATLGSINGQSDQIILDAIKGTGGQFSLERPTGLRFLIRSRLYTDEEWKFLKKHPVKNCG